MVITHIELDKTIYPDFTIKVYSGKALLKEIKTSPEQCDELFNKIVIKWFEEKGKENDTISTSTGSS